MNLVTSPADAVHVDRWAELRSNTRMLMEAQSLAPPRQEAIARPTRRTSRSEEAAVHQVHA
jgi:hypothetical protein